MADGETCTTAFSMELLYGEGSNRLASTDTAAAKRRCKSHYLCLFNKIEKAFDNFGGLPHGYELRDIQCDDIHTSEDAIVRIQFLTAALKAWYEAVAAILVDDSLGGGWTPT